MLYLTYIAAQLVKYIHFAVVAYICFGWIADAKIPLIVHSSFCIITVGHWYMFKGKCILTVTEDHLRSKLPNQPQKHHGEDRPGFISRLLQGWMGITIEEERLDRLLTALTLGAALISLSKAF